MPGVRSIAMKSIRTTRLISQRNGSRAPWGPLFVKNVLFILGKIFLNENDVVFDLSIGHPIDLLSKKRQPVNSMTYT